MRRPPLLLLLPDGVDRPKEFPNCKRFKALVTLRLNLPEPSRFVRTEASARDK